MASTPWIFPTGTVALADEYNGISLRNASYVERVKAEDGSYADIRRGANNQVEDAPMRAFGFPLASVPSGATITGFEMRISCYANPQGPYDAAPTDSIIRPVIHSGNEVYRNLNTGVQIASNDQIGQNLASSQIWPTLGAQYKDFRVYGGPANMWGVTEAQLRNLNFGFDLRMNGGGKNGAVGFIDSFQLRVHYEGGVPAGPAPITGTGAGIVDSPTGSASGTSGFTTRRTPHASSFSVASNGSTYAVAREGTGTSVYVNEYRWIGQYRASASSYDVNQAFVGFDTSNLPAKAITSAKLVLPVNERFGSAVVEARRYDWTPGQGIVPGSQLADHPLLGSATVNGSTVEIPLANVARDDLFKIVLAVQAQRMNVAPTGDDTFLLASTGDYLEVTFGDDIVVIMGSATGAVSAPTGASLGRSAISGVAAGAVPSANGVVAIRERLFGSAASTIPAPTGSASGSSGFAGVGSCATVTPTGSASGSSSIVGQGVGVVRAPTGSANARSKISAAATGIAIGQSGASIGSSKLTGSGVGQIAAPTGEAAGVSAVPGANGVGFGMVEGATGSATGGLSINGVGSGANVAPMGSTQGRSAIRGIATGTINAPTGSANGKIGESGSANGQVNAPTGSGDGRIVYLATASSQIAAPSGGGSASVGLTGETATIIEGPWGASTARSTITGEGSANISAPTGSAIGLSYLVGQEGVGQGLVEAPTGYGQGTVKITGEGHATIPAPTATASATVFVRGVAVLLIGGSAGSAHGHSEITGEGVFTIPAPSGEANGTSALVPRVGVGFGFAEGPSGKAQGTLAFTGQGNVTAMALSASVAASSAIIGQGSGTVEGPSGAVSGELRATGESVGQNAGFVGQAEGTSEILPIFGEGGGEVAGPSSEALATLTIRGEMVGMIPAPTGLGFGTGRLVEALPGTFLTADYDDRGVRADNDDRSLSADTDSRAAG